MKGYLTLYRSIELEPRQIIPLCIRVDQGVMVMKGYLTLYRCIELEPRQIIPLCIRVDQGVMVMKGYLTLYRCIALKPHQIIPLCISGPRSNGNEGVLHAFRNWSLTIRYNLVSCLGLLSLVVLGNYLSVGNAVCIV